MVWNMVNLVRDRCSTMNWDSIEPGAACSVLRDHCTDRVSSSVRPIRFYLYSSRQDTWPLSPWVVAFVWFLQNGWQPNIAEWNAKSCCLQLYPVLNNLKIHSFWKTDYSCCTQCLSNDDGNTQTSSLDGAVKLGVLYYSEMKIRLTVLLRWSPKAKIWVLRSAIVELLVEFRVARKISSTNAKMRRAFTYFGYWLLSFGLHLSGSTLYF